MLMIDDELMIIIEYLFFPHVHLQIENRLPFNVRP